MNKTSNQLPKKSLGFFPTPLTELKRFSDHLKGPRIFIKRDDLTGLAFGGSKTRKLEFLIADALSLECDTLITAGAAQSKPHDDEHLFRQADVRLNWPQVRSETRPWTWWWWHGVAVNKADISEELEEMHSAGIGGVCIIELRDVVDEKAKKTGAIDDVFTWISAGIVFDTQAVKSVGGYSQEYWEGQAKVKE